MVMRNHTNDEAGTDAVTVGEPLPVGNPGIGTAPTGPVLASRP
jgi:hypothetical protein